MQVFKGLDDWIEIFKGGMQVDGYGQEHDGDRLIERAVNTFNPAFHEPPIVIGHPKNDSPAYGWIKDLKSSISESGQVLLARFKDVAPEFVNLVKAGRFKKRSARFFSDGRLQHVGFLGAAAPAVKGLQDVRFCEFEDDSMGLEFEANFQENTLLEDLTSYF